MNILSYAFPGCFGTARAVPFQSNSNSLTAHHVSLPRYADRCILEMWKRKILFCPAGGFVSNR